MQGCPGVGDTRSSCQACRCRPRSEESGCPRPSYGRNRSTSPATARSCPADPHRHLLGMCVARVRLVHQKPEQRLLRRRQVVHHPRHPERLRDFHRPGRRTTGCSCRIHSMIAFMQWPVQLSSWARADSSVFPISPAVPRCRRPSPDPHAYPRHSLRAVGIDCLEVVVGHPLQLLRQPQNYRRNERRLIRPDCRGPRDVPAVEQYLHGLQSRRARMPRIQEHRLQIRRKADRIEPRRHCVKRNHSLDRTASVRMLKLICLIFGSRRSLTTISPIPPAGTVDGSGFHQTGVPASTSFDISAFGRSESKNARLKPLIGGLRVYPSARAPPKA